MVKVLASAAALTVIAGSAASIDAYVAQHRPDAAAAETSGDIVYRMVGELREVISAGFILKADEYFHGGTRHPTGEEEHCWPGDPSCALEEEESHAREPAAGVPDLWGRVNQIIYEHPVHHLAAAQQAETLPWFYLAARVDPHNIQAYVLGGYWLSIPLRKPEEAIMFLQDGLRRNPGSWQIYSQLGDVYFIAQREYSKAEEAFRRAYERLPADAPRPEVRHILTLLAAAAEKNGHADQAAAYRQRLDELFPSRKDSRQGVSPLPGG